MLDIIAAVKRAEEAAEERVLCAKEEAGRILKEAQKEARHMVQTAESTAEIWAKEYGIETRRSLQKEQEKMRKQTDLSCEELKARGEKQMGKALDFMIHEICGFAGESR